MRMLLILSYFFSLSTVSSSINFLFFRITFCTDLLVENYTRKTLILQKKKQKKNFFVSKFVN